MANWKDDGPIILAQDIADLIECFENQIVRGSGEPTHIVVPSISGTIDQFTEEVTFHTSNTILVASGIVGFVEENDRLLGLEGQIKVGDVKVTYPYNAAVDRDFFSKLINSSAN